MFNVITENLMLIGFAVLIFLAAYFSNVTFALWYNIKVLKQKFSREKFLTGFLKVLMFAIGLTLLCIAITALPIFATKVGWTIPQEYAEIFNDLIIIGIVLYVSGNYIKQAIEKFTAILNGSPKYTYNDTAEPEPGESEEYGGNTDPENEEYSYKGPAP